MIEPRRVLDGKIGKNDLIIIRGQKSYYQDHPIRLKEIIQKWSFKPKNSICRGIATFSILKLNDSVNEEIGNIHFCCNRLIINGEVYEIESQEILSSLNSDFQKSITKTNQFNSRREGRAFWKTERENKKLIHAEMQCPDWVLYDGFFRVKFSIANIDGSRKNDLKAFLENQRSNILEILNKNRLNFLSNNTENPEKNSEFLYHANFKIGKEITIDNTNNEIIFNVKSSRGFYEFLEGIEKRHFHVFNPWLILDYKE